MHAKCSKTVKIVKFLATLGAVLKSMKAGRQLCFFKVNEFATIQCSVFDSTLTPDIGVN